MNKPPPIQIAEPVLGDEEWQALKAPLTSGWVTQGPKVAAFEQAFRTYHGAQHAFAVTSCTTALHLCLLALGVGPGDEVIVPSFTWVATANAVLYCGATPVFADICKHSFNIDPADVHRKVTDKTRAIIAVHLFGLCADMDALPKNIPIVEDAACAAGASYRGKMAGTLGTLAAFSFHPRKIITTGEGGMITCAAPALAEKVNRLRNHGASIPEEVRHHGPKPYILPDFAELGFNYRMSDLQGAVGLIQMDRLKGLVERRRDFARFYLDHLSHIPWLSLPEYDEGHSWQSFVVSVIEDSAPFSRNILMERLAAMGISTRPGTHAVHMLDYYRDRFGLCDDDLPNARDCARHSMAIPLHNRMSQDDLMRVADALGAL